MDHDKKLKMIEAMNAYGGGFVKALAECFTRADALNMNRLLDAFPEYVEQYLAKAEKMKAKELQ